MKTIKNNIENEIIIKNSKFITLLIKLDNNNIQDLLNNIRNKYPKATHYCYGYIYNNIKHCSDDNEPTSTAGPPILNVLEKENLSNIIAIVVRYFGGIKLGAGGLIRAYTKSVTEALKLSEYIELIESKKVSITFPYNEEKNIKYLLKNSIIEKEEYNELITYIVNIPITDIKYIEKYNYKELESIYIEKKNI